MDHYHASSAAWSVTHPGSSYVPQYMTQDELKQKLDEALNNFYDGSGDQAPPRYTAVRVLMTIWDNDREDLKCGRELARLRDVFEKSYGYDCEVFELPTKHTDAQLELGARMVALARDASPNELIIFYYCGHATFTDDKPCIFLPGHPDQNRAYVDFRAARAGSLDFAKADVLSILDCCHANGASLGAGKELLAACAQETTAIKPSFTSFTTCLVQELQHAATTKNILTTSQLYARLVQNTFKLDGSNKPLLDQTPVHTELYPAPRMPIHFAPIIAAMRPPWQGAPLERFPQVPVTVLLSAHLRDGHRNTQAELEHWLTTSRPYAVQRVRILRNCPTRSSMLLFEVPVDVWHSLRGHPAMGFISVTGIPKPAS